jgi:putative ABC transport system permease protein
MTLVVKTSGEPLQALPAIRHALADVDRSVPIAAPRPMSDVVSGAIAAPRFTGWLLGLFAVTALTLAAIGIYGVLSYLVSQRTREIGIRVAVGAGPGEVLRLVVSRGLALALAGVVIGVVVAFAASRVMETLLFGVEPRDPMTFIGVPVVLTLVALAASVVPAIRAARVDPIVALRTE